MLKKILIPIILAALLFLTKYVLWDFSINTDKKVGKLTSIAKKGKFLPTWEAVIEESNSQKQISLSIADDKIGEELHQLDGKLVTVYYDEYLMAWPRLSKLNIHSWKVDEIASETTEASKADNSLLIEALSKTLFCSFLGSLRENSELYDQVKSYIKTKNLYLYNQYQKCN
jgi:hypothetical protein